VAAGEQMQAWLPHDRCVAQFWLRREYALINKRSPARKAAIERAIQRRIEDPCYFSGSESHRLTGGVR
jgi:hypothetical protein